MAKRKWDKKCSCKTIGGRRVCGRMVGKKFRFCRKSK